MSNGVFTHISDIVRPQMNRSVEAIDIGSTIWATLSERGFVKEVEGELKRVGYYVVCLNGVAVLQKDWNTVLQENDVLTVQNLPMGGGGSNVGMILVTIVAVAAAVFTGGASLAVAAAWGVAAGAAVGVLSSMIPAAQTSPSTLGRESASSTYTISSQANEARVLEAIPVQYGRMRIYPDLAAQPYTENRGNEMYLYQLMCVGQGDIDIEKLMIEDADISSFGEVQYEVVRPGGKVSLFPDNVVTSQAVGGLEMKGPNEENYTELGPFVVNPAGTKVNAIAVDVTFPQGAYDIDPKKGNTRSASATFRFSYRAIDDKGAPIGQWVELLNQTETFATQTAQMLSYKVSVPEGRYEVVGTRVDNAPTETRTKSTIQWAGLKSYVVSEQNYGNVTLLAVIIKATNNLNSNTSRRINIIGTRKLPTWTPNGGWTEAVKTSNPAWAFADALRNADYSVGMGTSRINMAELYRLSLVWDQRGDEFNGVFDTTQTLWRALTQIAAVGRAVPMYYAGSFDIVRDEPKSLPTAVFTPANMKRNSFKSSYKLANSKTPDYVIVEYFDRETWTQDTVECALPGSLKKLSTTVQMFGVTSRDQAFREGMYKAAVNRDQRRRNEWVTELDGLLPKFGDLVWVSHDVPAWGQSGRVISLNPSTGRIVTTEPMNFFEGQTHQIAFRKKNGKADGPFDVIQDPNPVEGVNSAIIQDTQERLQQVWISDGIRADLTFYQFGRTDKFAEKIVVLSAKPSTTGEVTITGTNYATSPHVAENGGDVPPPTPISELPNIEVGPIIDSIQVNSTAYVGQQQIVVTPANGAVYYEYQAKGANENWSALGISPNPYYMVNLAPGNWSVRARAVNSLAGPWVTWTGEIVASALPVPTITAFAATKEEVQFIRLTWSYSEDAESMARYADIYVSLTPNLGEAKPMIQVPYPATSYEVTGVGPGDKFFYWIRVGDIAGRVGAWFSQNGTEGRTTTDGSKILDYIAGQITKDDLFIELSKEIDKISGPASQQGSVAQRLNDLKTTVDGQITETNQTIQQVKADLEGQIKNATDAQEWNKTKTYATGDIVTLGNKFYQAKQAVPVNTTPPNTTYWRNAGDIIATADGLATRVNAVETSLTNTNNTVTSISSDVTTLKNTIKDKADATAVTSIGNRVTAAEGKIDSQGQSLTQLSNTVSGKADGSALAALTNRVTTAEGTITSQGNSITSLNNAVAGKADSSVVSALAGRVTTAEGSITSQGSSIVSLQNNLGNAGGENLLYNPTFIEPTPGSPNLPLGWNTDGASGIDTNYNATWSTVTSWLDSSQKAGRIDYKGLTENNRYFSFATNPQYRAYATAGQQLTCSGYVRGTAGIRMRIFIQAINASGVAISAPVSEFFTLTTAGARISFTATMPEGTVRISVFFRVYSAANGNGEGYVELSRAQLENGAIATGWHDNNKVVAAAQSATASAVQTLTNTVTQQGNTITSQSGSITSLNNSIKGAVQQSFNMVPNPTFDPAFNQMGFTVVSTTSTGVPANCPFPYAARITNRDNFPDINSLPNFPVKEGDVYRFSALVAAGENTGTRPFQHYATRATSPFGGRTAYKASQMTSVTQTWTRVTWDHTIPAGMSFMNPMLQIETLNAETATWYVTDWHCENITAAKQAQATADASASAVTGLNTRVGATETAITAQAGQITKLSSDVAGAGAFVSAQNFEFMNNNRGFYMEQNASGAKLTAYQQNLTLTGYANLRTPVFPELNGVQNPVIRMRIRRVNTTRNPIRIYWANEDGGLSEDRTATVSINLNSNDWQNIEIDLSATISWVTKTKITSIRFDFLNAADTNATLDIAWIAIGRKGPAASAQALTDTQTIVTQQGTKITSESTRLDQLYSRVGTAESAITTEQKARADGDSANASSIQTVQTNLNNTNASVQTISSTVNTINGKITASYQIKAGLTQDGKYYMAGIGVGVEAGANGIVQSKVYIATDRFAVIGAGATGQDMFVVENGVAYINTAFINKAYIVQAIIGQDVRSQALTNAGVPIMNLDFGNGAIYIRSQETNASEIQIDRAAFRCYVNNVLRVRIGRW